MDEEIKIEYQSNDFMEFLEFAYLMYDQYIELHRDEGTRPKNWEQYLNENFFLLTELFREKRIH